MKGFGERTSHKEIMDIRSLSPEESASVYHLMAGVNEFLGGTKVVLTHLENYSKKWKPGEKIRILDVGTGGSDIPAAVAQWARQKNFDVTVTALDLEHNALAFGKERHGGLRKIRYVQGSCFRLPFSEGSFDYVITSMFFHHLTNDEIIRCLLSFDRLASRGIIINDLMRSRRAYAGFLLLTFFIDDPVFCHDGLLSIRRAFRPRDLKDWIKTSGLKYLSVHRHFAFRLAAAGEKHA